MGGLRPSRRPARRRRRRGAPPPRAAAPAARRHRPRRCAGRPRRRAHPAARSTCAPPTPTASACRSSSRTPRTGAATSSCPGTGIFLHNRGIGFSLEPGHPAELAPGRRPPHTLSPLLVTDPDGALAAVLGTMGGDSQPQVLLQLLARLLLHGQSPGRAVSAPRWTLGRDGTGFDTWTGSRPRPRRARGRGTGRMGDGPHRARPRRPPAAARRQRRPRPRHPGAPARHLRRRERRPRPVRRRRRPLIGAVRARCRAARGGTATTAPGRRPPRATLTEPTRTATADRTHQDRDQPGQHADRAATGAAGDHASGERGRALLEVGHRRLDLVRAADQRAHRHPLVVELLRERSRAGQVQQPLALSERVGAAWWRARPPAPARPPGGRRRPAWPGPASRPPRPTPSGR